MPPPEPFKDVRMRGFQDRAEVSAVVALLEQRLRPQPAEPVGLRDAAGRVLAAAEGAVVFRAGRVLRPQDVGVLASLGASPVDVVRRPGVAILVTGDELLPCGAKPEGFRIVDSNSVMLEALVRRDGGVPQTAPLV